MILKITNRNILTPYGVDGIKTGPSSTKSGPSKFVGASRHDTRKQDDPVSNANLIHIKQHVLSKYTIIFQAPACVLHLWLAARHV